MDLTDEQWALYEGRYGKLMWRISHMISGDHMLASLEDNYSDLCMAALESINGFHKKTGKSFDEMVKMKLFDQYTKTCLWTAKARKGIKLTQKMNFRNKHISLSDDIAYLEIKDSSSSASFRTIDALDTLNSLGDSAKPIIDAINSNDKIISSEGKIKIKPLSKALDKTVEKTNVMLNKLGVNADEHS